MDVDPRSLSAIGPFRELSTPLLESILEVSLIRTFEATDPIIQYDLDLILQKYICFVLSGAVAIRDRTGTLMTVVLPGEYYLGRSFSLEGLNSDVASSVVNDTTVLFMDKSVLSRTVKLAPRFHTAVAEGYQSVTYRGQLFAKTPALRIEIEGLFQNQSIERVARRLKELEEADLDRKEAPSFDAQLALFLATIVLVVILTLAWESYTRVYYPELSASRIIFGIEKIGEYRPGAPFNVWLGIIGASIIALTNIHTILKVTNKKLFRLNLARSLSVHIFFGILGPVFVFFHTGMSVFKPNVPAVAFWSMIATIVSGFVGRFIYGLIPRTIRGTKLELNALLENQTQLKRKVELLVEDPNRHKAALDLIVGNAEPTQLFSLATVLRSWFREYRIRSILKRVGFSPTDMKILVHLIRKEARLKRTIAFLDVFNLFFKRWLKFHRPLAYFCFVMIVIHILIATLF